MTVAQTGQLTLPSNLAELSFSGTLSLGEGVVLTIQADRAIPLTFGSTVSVAAAAQLTVSGSVQLASTKLVAFASSSEYNLGTITFQDGVTAGMLDGTTPTVTGAIPGEVVLELGGSTVTTVIRTAGGTASASPIVLGWSAIDLWMGGQRGELRRPPVHALPAAADRCPGRRRGPRRVLGRLRGGRAAPHRLQHAT